MTKFEEEFNYLIELSGKVLIGQVDAEAFEKNRIAFFEKYETDQQQALPVVPECVAEFITKIKKAHNSLRFAFNSKFNECPAEYWNEAIVWRLNNPDEFARAWLDGYTVEKQQLFYLKNKLTTEYLAREDFNGYYCHVNNNNISNPYTKEFTQKEIDSMGNIDGYEKIEVSE
ncbi:DUF1642 domain-containing protein [Lactococcus lactis]|uniref:DUF1642 domain-containing protein n=1 Tax=Lactococcus lactis TaxID=1358 RepID=UPI003D109001